MEYSSFGIVALIIQLIINHDVLRPGAFKDEIPAHQSYRMFLICVMVYYVTDALWGILYAAKLIPFLFADTVVYFAAMAMSVLLWTQYVIAYLGEENQFKKILTAAGWVFVVLEAVLLIVNFFSPVMFSFEDGVYQAGQWRYVTLLLQVLLFLMTAIYTLIITSKTEGKIRRRHRTVGLYGLAMTVLVVIQTLYPLLPIYSIGFLVGTCLLHTFVLEDEKEEYREKLEEMLRREQDQKRELGSARRMAYTDSLTGVKNKHAYAEDERQIDKKIAEGTQGDFGVVVFDLNGLKHVNDTLGHEQGDLYIKAACAMICRQFKHSPVYRIGGDEFAAILEGEDYHNRQQLEADFEKKAEQNMRSGIVVVSSGLDEFRPWEDKHFQTVFERADRKMYERKRVLKGMNAEETQA